LPASMILRWPKGALWYGANSLAEMFSTLSAATLYRLNPALVSPLLYGAIDSIQDFLWPLLGVTTLACAAYQLRQRRADAHTRAEGRVNTSAYLAAALTAILTVTLAVHWLFFRIFHLLLPKDRTGIYVVPLTLAITGAVAGWPAGPPVDRWGAYLRRGLIAVLFVMAGYFLLCLRLEFFKEWEFDADVKDVYSVLACLNQDRGIRDVGTFWMYAAPLNFYRLQSGRETFIEFQGEVPYREEQQALVLNAALEKNVLDARGLKVIYKGKATDVVIAVRPEAEAALRSSVCLLRPVP
jgi:hypothetical protein